MKRVLFVWLASLILSASSRAQGFINLDFESAKVIFTTGGIATSNALPGWSVFEGTDQLSVINYDNYASHAPQLFGSNSSVINGNFDVWLVGTISQTGLVLSGSESLHFDTTSSRFLVSLGGQNLSCTAISSGTNSYGLSYDVYAADISAFAGKTESLTFLAPSAGLLDDIQFSGIAVPEPPTLSLFLIVGGVLIFVHARRRIAPVRSSHLDRDRL